MIIYIAKTRYDEILSEKDLTWDELKELFKDTVRTGETFEQYIALGKTDRKKQSNIKDVGGFVGGTLKNGRRLKDCVIDRTLITLDIDNAGPEIYGILGYYLSDKQAIVYSTHKHTHEKPRLRIIITLKEPLSPDEYMAVSRMVASKIGINYFDDTTYEPSRLMFLPSTALDGEYYHKEFEGLPIDGKQVLADEYTDWRDTTEWPLSDVQKSRGEIPYFKTGAGKAKDPREKPGIIGAWCKAYTIEEAIEKFLPDVYEPCGQDRYSYIPAETAAGLVVFDHLFAFSHHATDPVCGKSYNAFDLVRVHKFKELDALAVAGCKVQDLPSYKAMLDFAKKDEKVKKLLLEEAAPDQNGDTSWCSKLLLDKKNNIADNLQNYVLILENDAKLMPIGFNGLLEGVVVTGPLPWDRKPAPSERFSDYDYSCLRQYLNEVYHLSNKSYIEDAVAAVAGKRYFHPIRDYFNRLKWDGTFRLDTLLIDCLGAEDNDYTRAVTRKTFTAAATRVFEPGTKFDTMLVLLGEQGQGKSTLFAKMAGDDWFSDSLNMNDMKSKDAPEKLLGKLILEVPELVGMSKAEENDVKAFLSRRVDSYRAAFGRTVQDHKRQCIIVGTTNSKTGFLRDTTGNRRFWPVKIDSTKAKFTVWSMTQELIDQLWAEAVYWYKQGEALYLPKTVESFAKEQQRDQLIVDERKGPVEEFLEILLPDDWDSLDIAAKAEYINYGKDRQKTQGKNLRMEVSNIEIWCECFYRSKESFTLKESKQIQSLMMSMAGWKPTDKRKRIPGYGQQRVYVRVIEGPDPKQGPDKPSEEQKPLPDTDTGKQVKDAPDAAVEPKKDISNTIPTSEEDLTFETDVL